MSRAGGAPSGTAAGARPKCVSVAPRVNAATAAAVPVMAAAGVVNVVTVAREACQVSGFRCQV